MATMRVAQVSRPKGPFELVERPVPEPAAGTVRIKVQACGICHSDVLAKDGLWPGITYPRVPGHEAGGVIEAGGKEGPERWNAGQRVGGRGPCGYCVSCRRGDFFVCAVGVKVTGIAFDGGYGEYMIAPTTALALVPAELPAAGARPPPCAGAPQVHPPRN